MNLASDVALIVEPDVGTGAHSVVAIGGQRTDTRIAGSVLEGAVACDPGHLLFVTEDALVDEVLSIHLIGPAGQHLDSACIGGPYASGVFSDLRLEPPEIVRFRFIDDADWWIRILPRPRFTLPFLAEARGTWRGGRWRRHFVVDRHPKRWTRHERASDRHARR